jgi:ABC-type dipeptide/oligopeptide/nickel transport system permease subunit
MEKPASGFLRRFLKDWTAVVGMTIVALFALVAIAAPVVAPHDPAQVNASAILAPSSSEHWLGADNLGRDILSRLIHGARWSLGTAFVATTLVVVIGITVGLIAGFFGGLARIIHK